MHSFISTIILLTCLASSLFPMMSAHSAEPIKIGVLSFRPKPQTLAQWEPLAAELKQAIPEHDFVVEPLTYPEMNTAVTQSQIDFVLTNPSHYVLLARQSGLSAPLATLAAEINGKYSSFFGGVIFCRSDQTAIKTLGDIKGKTIAAPDTESLGGYQMQAYELIKAGVRLPQDATLMVTGMPHDKAVEAVLAGRADVGFVRSGVLEGLIHDGKLKINQLKIINLQNTPKLPLQLSTRLYPEWPFVAMPHIDENLARHVAAALFVLEDNNPSIHKKGIHGFVVPADYLPVEEVLRELRLPPFDIAPSFTPLDVWTRYNWQITATMIAIGLILILGIRLFVSNRKLAAWQRIVQQKQNELQQSEERFRNMANAAPVLIWIAGTDKLYYWFNQVWLDFTGRTMAQESGNGWVEGIHPDDKERCLETFVTAFDNRQPFSMEYRLRAADGQYRWLIDNGVPNYAGNSFSGYLGSCIDITDRKQAELDLFRESEKNKALLRNASDGVTIMDMDANVIEVNESFCTMLGYSRDEMIGMNVTNWDCGFDDQDELMEAFRRQLQSQTRTLFKSRQRRKDGSIYDVEIKAQPVDLEGHQVVFSSHRDMTDCIQSKNLLDEQVKALKLSEAQMTISQRIGGTGSFVYDFKTDIVQASTQMLRLFGLPGGHHPLDDFLVCLPQHSDLVRQTLAGKFGFPTDIADDSLSGISEHDPAGQTLTDLISRSHEYDAEFTLQPADGSQPKAIHAIGKIEQDRQGTPIKIFGFIQDVTKRRDAEAELVQAKIAADAANISKSRFLATMSHEIRTPMNGILGMAQLLLMHNLTENERFEYAKTIISSGHTLLTLLNDILDLSKIEAGKIQLDSIVFEPDSLLRDTQMLFSGTAHAKGLQLETLWKGLPSRRYVSDANRIRQMLSNLVGNAIKFTDDGYVRMEGVEIDQGGESALLEFSVSDTGMGIPPEKMGLLYKPFSQTDNSITRVFGGSGLGLSIVRHLAQMMGGDVGVESVEGKGSRFWFRLRAEQVAEYEDNLSAEQPANDETDPALLSGRVLVVEDNAVNCMVIESLLTKLGVNVTLAYDGQQALNTLIQGDCPDLVLMDLNMPIMDGYDATERIRQWERVNNRPHLPVIALTADAYEDDRQHCLAVGMDDFLAKPIELDALKSALKKWLPKSRLVNTAGPEEEP